MSDCALPTDCQKKLQATSGWIACGVWVDALRLLGDIAYCADDAQCDHQQACAREAARCASGLDLGTSLKSRLLSRLRQDGAPFPV